VKTTLHRILQRCGETIANLWLVVAGLTVLLAFQVSAIAASLFVGYAALRLTGGGTFGAIVFCVTAYLFGLFLAVYVWEPQVKRAVHSAADIIGKAAGETSNRRDARAIQRAFQKASQSPPIRTPGRTSATYRVIYSDGLSQQTLLTPEEIDRWAVASNSDAEGKSSHRIFCILDASGKTVWGPSS
jgi:hypothetical protein